MTLAELRALIARELRVDPASVTILIGGAEADLESPLEDYTPDDVFVVRAPAAPPPPATQEYRIGLQAGRVPLFGNFRFAPTDTLGMIEPALRAKWKVPDLAAEFRLVSEDGDDSQRLSRKTRLCDIAFADDVQLFFQGIDEQSASGGGSDVFGSTSDASAPANAQVRIRFQMDRHPDDNWEHVFAKGQTAWHARKKCAERLGWRHEEVSLLVGTKDLKDQVKLDQLRGQAVIVRRK
jgi:hypothetical protein